MSNFNTKTNTDSSKVAPIEIAIVGFGYWGRIISSNLTKCSSVKLRYICDSFEDNRLTARKTYPETNAVSSLDEALADDTLDLVVIATPTFSHFDLAKRTLLAGKHVLVEKPFVRTMAHALELKRLSEQVDRHIFVDHTFIFTPEVQEIKRMVQGGELGDIHMIDSCRMNFGKFQPDVNVAWDLGPHDLSILSYILDADPIAYYAEGSDSVGRGIEDTVHLSLKFEHDLMAYVHLSWISPRKERRMIISGSERMLIYDDSEPEMKIRLYDSKLVTSEDPHSARIDFRYETGNVTIRNVGGGQALVEEFHYVAKAVRGEVPHTLNTVDDAIWVLRALTRCDSILRREQMSINVGSTIYCDADVA